MNSKSISLTSSKEQTVVERYEKVLYEISNKISRFWFLITVVGLFLMFPIRLYFFLKFLHLIHPTTGQNRVLVHIWAYSSYSLVLWSLVEVDLLAMFSTWPTVHLLRVHPKLCTPNCAPSLCTLTVHPKI